MSTTALIVLIVALAAVAVAGWLIYRQQRIARLRNRFGPEYSHAVGQYGNEAKAVEALAARERRMEKIRVTPLSHEKQREFIDKWQDVQRDFVDDPASSIERADSLVCDVMNARGYPMSDFEHRAEDISVDHPEVVQNFRAAHAIAERRRRGAAGTEDLRQALVHYRNLFDELLEAHAVKERKDYR